MKETCQSRLKSPERTTDLKNIVETSTVIIETRSRRDDETVQIHFRPRLSLERETEKKQKHLPFFKNLEITRCKFSRNNQTKLPYVTCPTAVAVVLYIHCCKKKEKNVENRRERKKRGKKARTYARTRRKEKRAVTGRNGDREIRTNGGEAERERERLQVAAIQFKGGYPREIFTISTHE